MSAPSTSRPTTIEEALQYVDEVPESHFSKQDKTTITELLISTEDDLVRKSFRGDDPSMWLQRLEYLVEAAGRPRRRTLFVTNQSKELFLICSDAEGTFPYSALSLMAGFDWTPAKCLIFGEPEITRVYPSANNKVILDPILLGRRGNSHANPLKIKGISWLDGFGLGKLAHWAAHPYGGEAWEDPKKGK